MIKTQVEKIYYETDVITNVTCDICRKDITNENFYKMDLGYYFVPDKKGSFIEKVYDENSCHIHICESCAKNKLINVSGSIREYINENSI